MAISLTFIPDREYQRITSEAVKKGYWRNDIRILKPGSCWYMPWISNPEEITEEEIQSELKLAKEGDRTGLSSHYLEEWAKVRPPICVVCPNGRHWVVDQMSSNGTGWKVAGELPLITCSPSIVVPGYHGYLRNGVFTDDIEGRGETGILKEQAPSKRDLNPKDYE